jgi:hypothetical protein
MKLCRLHRTVASFSLDSPRRSSRAARRGTPDLPVFVRRHLDACPECRHALDAERALHERLITGAEPARLPAPPFFEARILGALVAPGEAGRARPHRRVRLAWWAPALAALALLAATTWLLRLPTSGPRTPVVTTVSPPSPAAFEMASLGLPSRPDLGGLSLTFEKPLEGEFRLAVSDVRRAAASLAEGLLPGPAAQALLRPAEPR